LIDKSKRYLNKDLNKSVEIEAEEKVEIMKENINFEENLEEKINNNKLEKEEKIDTKEFIVKIPNTAKKQDLLNLKVFLETQKK